jgi:hypothetical protein
MAVVDDAARLAAKAAKKKGSKGPGGHYADVDDVSKGMGKAFVDKGGIGGATKEFKDQYGLGQKMSDVGSWGWGNLQEAAHKEGRSVLGMVGRHAVQGGAIGGVAGGTIEAAQGGSFWDGAKQGAFNGAVGAAGVRSLKRATGADSYMFGKKNIFNSGGAMWRAHSTDAQVSKQAVSILTNNQTSGLARSFMNQSKKG